MASSPTGTGAAPAASIEHVAPELAVTYTAADFSWMSEEQLNAAAAERLQRWPRPTWLPEALLLEEEQEAQQAAKNRAKRKKR